MVMPYFGFFFFFNDTATTEIYTLSLHDALPICSRSVALPEFATAAPNQRISSSRLAPPLGLERTGQHNCDMPLVAVARMVLPFQDIDHKQSLPRFDSCHRSRWDRFRIGRNEVDDIVGAAFESD